MSSILEINGFMPGSLPSRIRVSMNSRSLRSKMMVVRLASSPFNASGTLGLLSSIGHILLVIGYMPYVFWKYIRTKCFPITNSYSTKRRPRQIQTVLILQLFAQHQLDFCITTRSLLTLSRLVPMSAIRSTDSPG